MRGLLLLIVLLVAGNVYGQPILYEVAYRPSGARFLVYETPHFDLIYQRGFEREAYDLGTVLETHLEAVATLVGHRGSLRMPVVVPGYNDNANGFVTVAPFKQEIDAISLKGPVITSRFRTWMEAVGPHELVHALHADARRGGGIGSILRPFAPDQSRALNLGGPSGVNEGVAVWYESSFREGAGRLQHPYVHMKYRAAMAVKPWSLSQMLERPAFTRPFDRHYIGGGFYAVYLATLDDFESFRRARRMFYRFPFLGYGAAMWFGNGEAPASTGRKIRRAATLAERRRQTEEGPFDMPVPLISESGTVHQSPQWLDDETIVVHSRGYALRPGFYAVDARSGERRLLSSDWIANETTFHVSPGSHTITFSRYVPDVLPSGAARASTFRFDPETGDRRTIGSRTRTHAPVSLADGSVLALENDGQFSRIVRLTPDPVALAYHGERQFRQIAPRPGTDQLAVLANVAGEEGVLMGRLSDEALQLDPWLFLHDMPIYHIDWSDDGRYLVFTAADGDRSNVFALDTADDSIYRLTNARYGALQGSMSPSNARFAYVHYRHERYELVSEPVRLDTPARANRVEPSPISYSDTPPELKTRPYRAWRYLAPRLFSPVVLLDEDVINRGDVELGPGVGLSVGSVDPLNRWSYGGQAYYRKESIWGSASLAYGGTALTPELRVYREPSTVLVRLSDGSISRVGRERRGLGATASLPLTLDSNVFSTRAGLAFAADYHQERLFDNDGRSIRTSHNLISLRPSAYLAYRLQANLRDLAPNTGLLLTTSSRLDLWDEHGPPARSVTARLFAYLPLLKDVNGTVQLDTGLLVQNERGGMTADFFLPRGFRDRYLGEGSFVRSGIVIMQPLTFVDDGLILLPIFLKSIYVHGVAEGLRSLEGRSQRFGSVTAGLGLRLRLFHQTDIELRWGVTLRSDARIRQVWR
ncbi:MAG: TolB family protein [Rhodothermales bacterium]